MEPHVNIVGAGLAGTELALQLSSRGVPCSLVERRPSECEPVHKTGLCAELVCSNSFKSTKPTSAAGLLKRELDALGSILYDLALQTRVDAGGALAVDREAFAKMASQLVDDSELISRVHGDAARIEADGSVVAGDGAVLAGPCDAVALATGPLTSDGLASWLGELTGAGSLAFFDAAAPIVMADSIDRSVVFAQNRYEGEQGGDYLNAPFTKDEYEAFIDELMAARRVIARDFESGDLFQACQPVEEVARTGRDALRYGAMKPVGLVDPRTGKRPWAVLQLRPEDRWGSSYNLVGFQTNLAFPEQERVFRMIPGLQNAQFARLGVMHRNTFLDAPRVMTNMQMLHVIPRGHVPVFLAGQITGTEGYTEAVRSGLNCAISILACIKGIQAPAVPIETAYGSLLSYATDPATREYQPKHVNFGDFPPLDPPVRKRDLRYDAYAARAEEALVQYASQLAELGLLPKVSNSAAKAGAPALKACAPHE